ncbi:MAG TPA: TetR/AcrR family transcriptional regulator [Puia sp.]|nr:TetR/AcrR family transcriptional regulator [Puia sp.]
MRGKVLDTRNVILKTALQLFLKKGYKDVSYQDLMEETGLSKGALYHHFKSKKELLAATFEFLLEASRQPVIGEPENQVKDYKSFVRLFLEVKSEQIATLRKFLNTRSLKFNRLLFFLEAIIENEKLKRIIDDLMKGELQFLESCFIGLERHGKINGKHPGLLAKNLFWVLQGSEMDIYFLQKSNREEDILKMYEKTLMDFFKII